MRAALFSEEDWLAVWIGLLSIVLVLAGFRPQHPITVGLTCLCLSVLGVALTGGKAAAHAAGFPIVFALGWLAQTIASNSQIAAWGLEYVIFALFLGLLIGNTFSLPQWVRESVRTEYYIKIGLVIFGAGILFQEILQAGLLGVVQASLVIVVVWYGAFWISKKLHVDDEFAVLLSTAVSICGVSAAIAACGAIQGDRRKLSYVTSLVLIVAMPMMVAMPWVVRHFQMPDAVGGAWIGGTVDTSGAVVAAGALLGEAATKISVIVKFSQNALIGVAAFFLSIWWALRHGDAGAKQATRPTLGVIWSRFPKFVLGFMAASLIFSFALSPALVSETRGILTGLRTAWFALAFTSIGLETRFADLIGMEDGRPAVAFLAAQCLNIVWTLIVAYLLFGGVLFEVPNL
jgi:uncharacterized integral membrane protein (TIGR00698 family)